MAPLLGLVLAGGRSSRMGSDKGALVYSPSGEDQRSRCARLLAGHCGEIFVSCREEQRPTLSPGLHALVDLPELGDVGPAAGLITAHRARPDAAWLVLAVDFPGVTAEGLSALVHGRDGAAFATCFVQGDGTPEPLMAIWEPAGLSALEVCPARGARRVLESGTTARMQSPDPRLLVNVNTEDERRAWDHSVLQGTDAS